MKLDNSGQYSQFDWDGYNRAMLEKGSDRHRTAESELTLKLPGQMDRIPPKIITDKGSPAVVLAGWIFASVWPDVRCWAERLVSVAEKHVALAYSSEKNHKFSDEVVDDTSVDNKANRTPTAPHR